MATAADRVAAVLREAAPAKVNLTLRVLGRRADGYHELESLVAFADVADVVTLDPDAPADIVTTGPFAAGAGPAGENLVLKAAREMTLDTGRFTLEKNIPVAAGLGGGSADAAAALRLIALLRKIDLDDPRLHAAALRCGADVPVCLTPRARVMRGIGDRLSSFVELPTLHAVLVNPNVALTTRDVFAAFRQPNNGVSAIGEMPRGFEPFIGWLKSHGNDLTPAALSCAPVIGDVLAALQAMPGCRLARMSGSGATCVGLFASADAARAAAERLEDEHSGWWVRATALR